MGDEDVGSVPHRYHSDDSFSFGAATANGSFWDYCLAAREVSEGQLWAGRGYWQGDNVGRGFDGRVDGADQ